MRVGGGLDIQTYGKWLDEHGTVTESIVYGVLSLNKERFGAPEFGTLFLEAIEDNEPQAIQRMNTEAYAGASAEKVILNEIRTDREVNPETFETTLITSVNAQLDDDIIRSTTVRLSLG